LNEQVIHKNQNKKKGKGIGADNDGELGKG
jgi:hypothetical protein